jgi:hypothetical protein
VSTSMGNGRFLIPAPWNAWASPKGAGFKTLAGWLGDFDVLALRRKPCRADHCAAMAHLGCSARKGVAMNIITLRAFGPLRSCGMVQ